MIEEAVKLSFLQKLIGETNSGILTWDRKWSADIEYGAGYIYSAVLDDGVHIEIFRYRNSSFTMGEVLPSFKLYVGAHNTKYISANNDACHKLLEEICNLADSVIQNGSDKIILDYLKKIYK